MGVDNAAGWNSANPIENNAGIHGKTGLGQFLFISLPGTAPGGKRPQIDFAAAQGTLFWRFIVLVHLLCPLFDGINGPGSFGILIGNIQEQIGCMRCKTLVGIAKIIHAIFICNQHVKAAAIKSGVKDTGRRFLCHIQMQNLGMGEWAEPLPGFLHDGFRNINAYVLAAEPGKNDAG